MPDQADLRRRQLGEVLNAIRGRGQPPPPARGRRALHRGLRLPLDADLAARYGKTTGTAFAGIVAGPNKVMRRVARRDLISWDADVRGYRMDPADAEIVLQRWPAVGFPPSAVAALAELASHLHVGAHAPR